jgi:hypothetical protein
MSRMVELPEPVYAALLAAARDSGVAPADWIAARLSSPNLGKARPDSLATARADLFRHVVSTGAPTDTDNDAIDADLARGYADRHEADNTTARSGAIQ